MRFVRKRDFESTKPLRGYYQRSFKDVRRDEFVFAVHCCRGSGAVLQENPTAGSDRTLRRRRMYRTECFYIDARLIIDTAERPGAVT